MAYRSIPFGGGPGMMTAAQRNAINYIDERQADPMLAYGMNLLQSKPKSNSTSSAAAAAGEKILGALLTGMREKNYRGKEKEAKEQWNKILAGGEGGMAGMQARWNEIPEPERNEKVGEFLGNYAMYQNMMEPERLARDEALAEEKEQRLWQRGFQENQLAEQVRMHNINAQNLAEQRRLAQANASEMQNFRNKQLEAQEAGTWNTIQIPGQPDAFGNVSSQFVKVNNRTGEVMPIDVGQQNAQWNIGAKPGGGFGGAPIQAPVVNSAQPSGMNVPEMEQNAPQGQPEAIITEQVETAPKMMPGNIVNMAGEQFTGNVPSTVKWGKPSQVNIGGKMYNAQMDPSGNWFKLGSEEPEKMVISKGQEAEDKKMMPKIDESFDDATRVIDLTDNALKLLDSGINTGALFGPEKFARQLGSYVGLGDDRTLANMESFQATMEQLRLGMSKFMKGAVSDNEQKIMALAAGNASMSPQGLRQVLEVTNRANKRLAAEALDKKEYFDTHGTMRGYKQKPLESYVPAYNQEEPRQSQDNNRLSDEELLRRLYQ